MGEQQKERGGVWCGLGGEHKSKGGGVISGDEKGKKREKGTETKNYLERKKNRCGFTSVGGG